MTSVRACAPFGVSWTKTAQSNRFPRILKLALKFFRVYFVFLLMKNGFAGSSNSTRILHPLGWVLASYHSEVLDRILLVSMFTKPDQSDLTSPTEDIRNDRCRSFLRPSHEHKQNLLCLKKSYQVAFHTLPFCASRYEMSHREKD